MFLKVTKSKDKQYLQLVESYREGKKVRHRVLANLGEFDALGKEQIKRIGERCFDLIQEPRTDIGSIEEKERLVYGQVVVKRLWEQWRLSELLKELNKGSRVGFDVEKICYLLTVDRLLTPQSKLKSYEQQLRYVGQEEIELHQLYRCLDKISEGKEYIEDHIYERRKNIFNYQVDIVFYDVTTFHFESVEADELRGFGFSKACKFNEVQVVLGLLVDSYGVPVGFDLFAGNTYEGATLVKAIEKLKKRFVVGEVIIVSDKGMSSKKNFWNIREAGYHYVISARLRSLSEITRRDFSRSGL